MVSLSVILTAYMKVIPNTLFKTLNVVTVDGSIPAETSPNGLNSLTGLPASDATVSLSPDAAVKKADNSVLSQGRHAALSTCASLPPTSSPPGLLFC